MPRPELLGKGRRRDRFKGLPLNVTGGRGSNCCVHHPPRGRNGNFLFHAFSFCVWHGDMFCAFALVPRPPLPLQSPSPCHGRPFSLCLSLLLSRLRQLLFLRHAARNASSDSHTASRPLPFPLLALFVPLPFVHAGHFRLIHTRVLRIPLLLVFMRNLFFIFIVCSFVLFHAFLSVFHLVILPKFAVLKAFRFSISHFCCFLWSPYFMKALFHIFYHINL